MRDLVNNPGIQILNLILIYMKGLIIYEQYKKVIAQLLMYL